jgi:16S rRNA processing protein RimM
MSPRFFMPEGSLFRLGIFSRTFGLAGGLRCTLDTELVPKVTVPCEVRIGFSEAFARPQRLVRCDEHSGSLLCFLEGVDSQERAQQFVDQALFIGESDINYADPLAHPRLIGYSVQSEDGNELGEIQAIFRTSAHPVWSIRAGEREWMIPAIGEFLLAIDDSARRATVRLIPGMFEEESGNEEGGDT